MATVIVFLVLWAASFATLVLIPFGSDHRYAWFAWLLGWISFNLLALFAAGFAVNEFCWWLSQHIQWVP